MLASLVGIVCNLLLFGESWLWDWCFTVCPLWRTPSITCPTLLIRHRFHRCKMAEKPADEEHPFGHGRIEYIAALIVSFLVIEVGFTFFKNAIAKIRTPEELSFNLISMGILLASVAVKLWLSFFNKKLGKRINSTVMQATATDALGDVVTTLATMVSILFFYFTKINIDGYVGLAVSLLVMWPASVLRMTRWSR